MSQFVGAHVGPHDIAPRVDPPNAGAGSVGDINLAELSPAQPESMRGIGRVLSGDIAGWVNTIDDIDDSVVRAREINRGITAPTQHKAMVLLVG
jgi:hypothetical protein